MQHIESIYLSEDLLALLAKYLAMETSADENQEVEEWLKQKPGNASVLFNISRIISGSGKNELEFNTNDAWKKLEQRINIKAESKVVRLNYSGKQKIWWAAACAIIILAAAILYKFIYSDNDIKNYKGLAAFQLKDGTKVKLQKDAELLVANNYNDESRIVQLRGNGFFEIAKDSAKPFIINMNDRKLTVLGTAFSIIQEPSNNYFNVKVTEGVVKIDDSLNNKVYKLIAGQELSLSGTDKKIEVFSAFEKLKFENAGFSDILNTIEKVYRIKFVNELPAQNKASYTIDLSSEPLDKALETISTLTGITIEHINDSTYRIR